MQGSKDIRTFTLQVPSRLSAVVSNGVEVIKKKSGVESVPLFTLKTVSDELIEISALDGTVIPGLGLINGLAEQLGVDVDITTPLIID